MRALQSRHTAGHERQGWSSHPSGAARHLGSKSGLVLQKYKTVEGLPEPCKQAMPATLQIPREACPGNERGSMPSHTASGPAGCASDAILSTAVPTQTARTSLPRRRKAATGKELRPSITQTCPMHRRRLRHPHAHAAQAQMRTRPLQSIPCQQVPTFSGALDPSLSLVNRRQLRRAPFRCSQRALLLELL